jgi:hypothetical protein
MERIARRIWTPLLALLVFGVNLYISRGLFALEFGQRMEAIESSYMSISRWAIDHWNDLSWFPLWFTGTPFHQVYQPGLHLTVAALARAAGWTPQHSYHFLTALAYCLGPVALFGLAYHGTRRRGYALLAGLLYSLASAVTLLVPAVAADAGGMLGPRRFQILIHYGEGPHTAALALIPIAIWLLDRAVAERRKLSGPLAALGLAAVVLTNWPGTIGLSMAVAAYCLSKIGSPHPIGWRVLAGACALGYLVVCPWVPPSIAKLVLRNAQQSAATMFGIRHALALAAVAGALAGMHLLFRRYKADRWLRFFVYFAFLSGLPPLGKLWFGWRLLPQPERFQTEFDMAVAGIAAYGALAVGTCLPRKAQAAALALVVVFFAAQARSYRRYARIYVQPIDITSTIEYRMAKWFDANMQGRRVFAPGNVSLWMNMFTDVPQVAGCCDQGIPTMEHRIAVYVIYTGQNAGARDAEISVLWLKAYGADAIGVTGPNSGDPFNPYWNPRKFDGVLPLLWRDGDSAVYAVPRRPASLAHVIDRNAVVARPPENGLDVAPLEALVASMENPANPPASFRWKNLHEAEIDAQPGADQVIFAQVTYDAGWRVVDQNGVELKTAPDALGLMTIEPRHAGPARIRLIYDGGLESKLARVAQIVGVLLLAAWALKRDSSGASCALPGAPSGTSLC